MDSTEGARPQQMAPVGIAIVDLDGRTTMVDEVLRHCLGYDRQEFAAMPLTAYSH